MPPMDMMEEAVEVVKATLNEFRRRCRSGVRDLMEEEDENACCICCGIGIVVVSPASANICAAVEVD